MKNNVQKIKHIFIKKMIYSSIAQILVLCLLIIFVRNYMNHTQLTTMIDDLIIKDQYTIDQIGSYQILGNKYALDLELHNLGDMRKLDSIKFVHNLKKESQAYNCTTLNDKNFQLCRADNGNHIGITAILSGNKNLGYILTSKKYRPILSVSVTYDLFLIILTVFGTFLFNFIFLFLSLKKRIESNTQFLIAFISSETNASNLFFQIDIEEYKTAAQIFISEKNQTALLQKDKIYYEAKKIIAEQVAHDIRSPLAAINTAVSDTSFITENRRIMIRNASKRINDIANNLLLKKNNIDEEINPNTESDSSSELIFVALDNIISEKRYEHFTSQINIQLNVSTCAYDSFSNINLSSFKRILSNLLNNSIEAICSNGSVTAFLKCNDDTIHISIEDNGCGIPRHIISKVTEHGFTHNKKNGAGVGLAYAKQHIEKLNGTIHIHSEENVGTKVTIILPRSDYPPWFCKTVYIKSLPTIIVLDDDPSIHDA